jgi:ubiquinone/menaquinone biosynthesis C-methylase UbiE
MDPKYENTRATYNRIAQRYAEQHSDFKFWKKPYEIMLRILPKGSTILDAGCGPGRDTEYFLNNGYNVTGIDYSEGMIAEARRRVPEGDFQQMDMLELEFRADYFDAIWACASLLHLKKDDAKKAVQGFSGVLKHGGILFVAVKEGTGSETKKYPDGSERFFSYYTLDELKELVTGAGYEVLETYIKKDDTGDTWLCIIAKRL